MLMRNLSLFDQRDKTRTNEMNDSVIVIIADSDVMVAELLANYLTQNGMRGIAVSSLQDAEQAFLNHPKVDAFLLDIDMEAISSLTKLERMVASYSPTPVILLSARARREVIEHMISAGARGYIPKSANLRTLLNALNFVLAGETFVPATFIASPIVRVRFNDITLSSREIEVLRQVRLGKMNKEIAVTLGLSELMVKRTVRNICVKLSVKTRTEAAFVASGFLPD